ncbi:beta glucanase [Hahella sp. CCB-MM4]|uniref:family 16 glycosylhydrolase n=1 Tax=Hahella sp. (strain CCB-MM4) TaxID=1926491 RepID=UPI000B9BA1AE|nr:family 16 glycosylhydrolase [Hahella sp. CCB-MM4]OZG72987.1 beta glucanase [Hahella sp. CCB-MM4]
MKTQQKLYMSAMLAAFALGGVSTVSQAKVFQAEDYSYFYDVTPGNSGGAYRSDDVDIESTSDVGGGYNVGWIDKTEWLAFNDLNIATSGTYRVKMRVASINGGTASVDLNGGNIVLGSVNIPATGGWQNWRTVEFTSHINAGSYSLGVYASSSGWNLNWIEVVKDTGGDDGQQPLWSDEFNSIDANTWTFETGGGGWGNQELQYYTNGQNAYIAYDAQAGSNVLVIEARKENPAGYNCWYGTCQYTSTRLISRDKKSFKYGRMEARIKLPQTQGIWPAFWMLGDSFGSVGWPEGGEIDIMEHVGYEPTLTHGALHGPGYSGNTPITGTYNVGQVVDANYHTFAVEWDTNGIRWLVDGNEFYSASRAQVEQYGRWVYDQPFWFLFNVAVGGNWPGSPDGSSSFPQKMYIDYVRVYQ